MKNVIFVLLLLPGFLAAQEDPIKDGKGKGDSGTGGILVEYPDMLSEDEWAYVTRGYLDDIKLGKDPSKKGLEFEVISTNQYDSNKLETVVVKGTKCKCIKGFIVVMNRASSYCIPVTQAVTIKGRELKKQVTQPYHKEVMMTAEQDIIKWLLRQK